MKMTTFFGGFALGCATVFLAATMLTAQDGQPTTIEPPDIEGMEQMEQMFQEAMEKYGTPSEEHEMLAKRVGKWNCEVKMWWAPGMEPEISEGTATYEMMANGRFLKGEFHGDFNGQPFVGHSVTGYNRMKKMFENVWLDDWSTAVTMVRGEGDGNVIEYEGEMPDMMKGEYVESRQIERMIDEDTLVLEMYSPGMDGEMMKSMEITYTRASE